jgi:ankyrin repeat protein
MRSFLKIRISKLPLNEELVEYAKGISKKTINPIDTYIANEGDINAIYRGYTLLHYAVEANNDKLVAYLIKMGAKHVKAQSFFGSGTPTPLEIAVQHNFIHCAELLLDSMLPVDLMLLNDSLFCSIKNNHYLMTKLLIDRGADVNSRDADELKTPLHYVISQSCMLGNKESNRKIFTLLMGSNIDLTLLRYDRANDRFYTYVEYALKNGSPFITFLESAMRKRESSYIVQNLMDRVTTLESKINDLLNKLYKTKEEELHKTKEENENLACNQGNHFFRVC